MEQFLEKNTQSYDVIIVDSIGGMIQLLYAVYLLIKIAGHNNEILKKPFYEKLNKALKNDNGIVCAFGKNS